MDALVSKLRQQGSLTEKDLDALKTLPSRSARFDAGAQVIAPGEPTNRMFVVEAGWGYRSRSISSGRRQIVNFMLPGDCFDLQAIVATNSDHAVYALTPMTIRVAPTLSFMSVVRANAGLASAFWLAALQEESILREHIVRLGTRGARERFAHLLLELRRRALAGGASDAAARRVPATREILADALGLSVVHLSRVVAEFAKTGLLAIRHRMLELIDVGSMAKICGYDPAYLHLQPAEIGGV